jgi:hypothetical protein
MPLMRPLARATATLLLALLASCTSVPISDADYATALAGRWVEVRAIENERHEQIINLNSNGSFLVSGTKIERGVVTPFAFSGIWEVRTGYFWYKTLTSQPADFYPPGEEYKDRIVSVTNTEWVMLEESSGQESRAWRYPQQ